MDTEIKVGFQPTGRRGVREVLKRAAGVDNGDGGSAGSRERTGDCPVTSTGIGIDDKAGIIDDGDKGLASASGWARGVDGGERGSGTVVADLGRPACCSRPDSSGVAIAKASDLDSLPLSISDPCLLDSSIVLSLILATTGCRAPVSFFSGPESESAMARGDSVSVV